MQINLSEETIKTVQRVLKSEQKSIKWCLEVSLPNGKINPDKKEELKQKLAEVEDALQVFDELAQ